MANDRSMAEEGNLREKRRRRSRGTGTVLSAVCAILTALAALALQQLAERRSQSEVSARASWPSERQLGPRGWSSRLQSPTGVELHAYHWPSETARARIVLAHGHGEHACFDFLRSAGVGQSRQYDGSWIRSFNARGFSVASLDHAGHGRSDGARCLRGFVERFDDHVTNLIALFRSIEHSQPLEFENDKPLFLMGVSMGGHVALRAAERLQQEYRAFHGVVLLAPMLSLEKAKGHGLNRLLLRVGKLASEYLPTVKLVSSPTEALNEQQLAEFRADPLNLVDSLVRARVANEYLEACIKLAQPGRMENVTVPFAIFHSSKDDIVEPFGSYELYRRASSSDKSFTDVTRLSSNMSHLVTQEPGNEMVLERVVGWMEERVGE